MDHIYDGQVKELLHTLFHSTDLHQLINCGASILKNPLSIFDTNYYALAYSDFTGIDDALWTAGKVGGYCLYEYAAMLHRLESSYMHNPKENAFIYHDIDNFGDHRRRIIPLVSNSVIVGYVSVLEYNKAFDDVSQELYRLVVGALSKEVVVVRAFKSNNQCGSSEALLLDLLNSSFVNRALFNQRVMGTDFAQPAHYRLVSVNMDGFEFENPKHNNFKSAISSLFPRSWSVFIRNDAILLVNCGKDEDLPAAGLEQLRKVIADHSLIAGTSDSFDDLYEINQYYEQARMAARMAKRLKGADAIALFDDYKLWCCVDMVFDKESGMYTSVLVKQLAEHDAHTGSEYVQTLFSYLDSGKSLLETARKMHVHRNTIVYRLERIKALFDVELSSTSGYEDMQNYLGCMMAFMEKLEE